MTSYRKLTPGGDFTFGGGSQDFYKDAEAVRQAVLTRLKLLQDEWWEDVEDGLPLFQSILGQSGSREDLDTIDLLVQDRILGTPDVTGVNDFVSSYSNRTYSCECTVDTTYGAIELEVIL